MTILEMTAGGGVLIAVTLVLRRALLYRLPKWTFLLLWAVVLCRLLIPFSLPSRLSVYTGATRIVQAFREEPSVPESVPAPNIPQIIWPESPTLSPGALREDAGTTPALPETPAPKRESVSPLAAVYLTGTALSGLFFGAACLWSLRRFWDAVPAEGDFLRRWQKENPTLLPVHIKVSGAVTAPLAYGLIHPVILLPQNTDWTDEGRLTYVLTHEYVHIRRGDLFWKLLLTAALCVHWFNPLVWVMYFQANRDLELACDERVVRILGLDSRKGYAYSLLSAAESGFSPLCLTYTTKNHMEERIRAIMKIRKQSLAVVLTAALLVAGVTAVFATSPKAPESKDISGLPSAVMTNQGNVSESARKPDESRENSPAPVNTPSEANFTWPLPQAYQEISYPFAGRVVSPVTGQVKDHPGIDISAPKGTAVYAAKSGVVARSEQVSDYGNLVELSHSDGASTLYAHLSHRAVEVGQTVKQGETIGAVGATGNATGPVLHFGVFMDGSPVDPAGQFAPADTPADTSTPDDNRVHPITGEASQTVLENRWDVPEGEIPQLTEFTVADFDDADELGKYLEATHGLYPGDYTPGRIRSADGTRYTVQITYSERKIRERLPDGVYPVNSKGETYGTTRDHIVVGYNPDLVLVQATNGKSGYAFEHDLTYGDYPGEIRNPDDAMAYMEWLKTQPDIILIPVYDVNRDNIIGYFKISRSSDMTPEEELKMVEDQMRHNTGLSEEEIAKELEALKQSKGWS